jgi:hypothetical protein
LGKEAVNKDESSFKLIIVKDVKQFPSKFCWSEFHQNFDFHQNFVDHRVRFLLHKYFSTPAGIMAVIIRMSERVIHLPLSHDRYQAAKNPLTTMEKCCAHSGPQQQKQSRLGDMWHQQQQF